MADQLPPAAAFFRRLAGVNLVLGRLKSACEAASGASCRIEAAGFPSFVPGLEAGTVLAPSLAVPSDPEAAFFARFASPATLGTGAVTPDVGPRAARSGIQVFWDAEPADAGGGVRVFVPASGRLTAEPPRGAVLVRSDLGGSSLDCAVLGLPEGAFGEMSGASGLVEDGRRVIELGRLDLGDYPTTVAIHPDRLLHDGGYRAERDGNYHWLWTGPDPHFRVLVGIIPFRPADLSLVVASEGTPGNADGLKVYVNGVPRRLRFQRWGDESGRVSVRLGREVADPVVLSVAVPKMNDVGGRKLGISVGLVEIREPA